MYSSHTNYVCLGRRQCVVVFLYLFFYSFVRYQVLDEGRIVEFDEPYTLLQDESGMLSSMVAETGNQESIKLTAIAKQKYFNVNIDKDIDEQIDGEETDQGDEGGDEGGGDGGLREEDSVEESENNSDTKE